MEGSPVVGPAASSSGTAGTVPPPKTATPRVLTVLVAIALILAAIGAGLSVYSLTKVASKGTASDQILFDGTLSAIRGNGAGGYTGYDNFTIPGSDVVADIGVVVTFAAGGCGDPPAEECLFQLFQSTSSTSAVVEDGFLLIAANTTETSTYHANAALPSGSMEMMISNAGLNPFSSPAQPFSAQVTVTYYGTFVLAS